MRPLSKNDKVWILGFGILGSRERMERCRKAELPVTSEIWMNMTFEQKQFVREIKRKVDAKLVEAIKHIQFVYGTRVTAIEKTELSEAMNRLVEAGRAFPA